MDAIIWSSSIYDKNPKSINLDQFYSIDNYKIISEDFIQYNNVYININCIMKGDENKIWIGTESGEIFKCDLYTKKLNKINNIPYLSNFNLSYLDQNNEWWLSTNNIININNPFLFSENEIFLSHC